MKTKLASLLSLAVLSSASWADITSFTPPAATGGGHSSGAFSPLSAEGFYIAGSGLFDNHWLVTFDSTNPGFTFTVENSFNPRSGGGALSFNSVTLSGPGLAGVPLNGGAAICPIGPGDCITRRSGSFAVFAGTYDLAIAGGNPFNGSYRVNVSAVPEPASSALAGVGVVLLMLKFRTRLSARPFMRGGLDGRRG